MNSKYITQLKKVRLFEGMTEEEITRVLGCLNAHTCEYSKGSFIYLHGDQIHEIGIVLEGRASVTSSCQNGNVLTLHILDKNDSFGEEIICLEEGYAPYSLITNAKTKILFIDGKKLTDPLSIKCEYRSHVNLNMLKSLAEYNFRMNQRMKYISILNLKKRVATFLIDHEEKAQNTTFSIGMNREEMASYLNATRSAVSRILVMLKDEALISYRKDVFKIIDHEALLAITE